MTLKIPEFEQAQDILMFFLVLVLYLSLWLLKSRMKNRGLNYHISVL